MFPVGDDNTGLRSIAWVTWTLIAINLAVFFLQLQGGENFTREWAFVPARFNDGPTADSATLVTAMFMHGGWMHLFGNMLYLWIFGDNVEDRFGKLTYLAFYLLTGFAATFSQYYVNPGSTIPNVGASGAISGVLGAYILLFPKAKVNVIVLNMMMVLPAVVVLGFWIALQLFSGVGSIAATDETINQGGVAYMAHVGGFVAGVALALVLKGVRRFV